MINNTSIVGRMVADCDLRYTQAGKAVGNFKLAVNRPFKNAQGENEADFIQCVCWGKQAENLANYMKKGSQVGVTGRIQTRNYENNEGKRIYVTEVVADQVAFLESKSKSNNQSQSYNEKDTDPVDIPDSDLPF